MAKAKVAESGDAAALLVINDKEGCTCQCTYVICISESNVLAMIVSVILFLLILYLMPLICSPLGLKIFTRWFVLKMLLL